MLENQYQVTTEGTVAYRIQLKFMIQSLRLPRDLHEFSILMREGSVITNKMPGY